MRSAIRLRSPSSRPRPPSAGPWRPDPRRDAPARPGAGVDREDDVMVAELTHVPGELEQLDESRRARPATAERPPFSRRIPCQLPGLAADSASKRDRSSAASPGRRGPSSEPQRAGRERAASERPPPCSRSTPPAASRRSPRRRDGWRGCARTWTQHVHGPPSSVRPPARGVLSATCTSRRGLAARVAVELAAAKQPPRAASSVGALLDSGDERGRVEPSSRQRAAFRARDQPPARVQDELAADETLEARAAYERDQLLLERAV